jgi:hypothetical protein
MSAKERYIIFELRLEETNKLHEEKYKLIYKEIEEKHKLKVK